MIRYLLTVLLLAGLVCGNVYSLQKASADRKTMEADEPLFLAVPAPLLRLSALEYDSLLADFLLLRSMTFIGESTKRDTQPQVTESEWRQLYAQLEAGTELDPYFLDLYYFANAHLTWGGGMIKETNALLAKGSAYRDWDWQLPFFQGFNEFFFLERYDIAAEYLMESSRRPMGNPALALLASRLAIKGKRTENAILFVKELLRDTVDYELRKKYQHRLDNLELRYRLELAIDEYQKDKGTYPENFEALFASGHLKRWTDRGMVEHFSIGKDGEVTDRE